MITCSNWSYDSQSQQLAITYPMSWCLCEMLQIFPRLWGLGLIVFMWDVTYVLQMMGAQFGGVCVGCYMCSPCDGVSI